MGFFDSFVSQIQAVVWLPGRCWPSDPGRREGAAQHVQGLEEIVRAPDQLVLGREVNPLVVAAVGEDPALVEVALDQRGHGSLGSGLVPHPLGFLWRQRGQLQQRRGGDGRTQVSRLVSGTVGSSKSQKATRSAGA